LQVLILSDQFSFHLRIFNFTIKINDEIPYEKFIERFEGNFELFAIFVLTPLNAVNLFLWLLSECTWRNKRIYSIFLIVRGCLIWNMSCIFTSIVRETHIKEGNGKNFALILNKVPPWNVIKAIDD
jgi:hypothetical protein